MTMIRVDTPNKNSRRGRLPLVIVLHCDASPSSEVTRDWIKNPASKVSYHKDIHRDGTITQFVDDEDRAWACGVSQWRDYKDVNSISLSVSFANRNDGKELLTPIQMATMKDIVRQWRQKFPSIVDITTHAAVAPGRKFDPIQAPNFKLEDYR